MKYGSKKHQLTKRMLKINPNLTVAQMAYRVKLYDEFKAIRKVAA